MGYFVSCRSGNRRTCPFAGSVLSGLRLKVADKLTDGLCFPANRGKARQTENVKKNVNTIVKI
jgi:hypothetical protein